MFSFLKKPKPKKNLSAITLEITGMHCTSCALNIDMTLEELDGVSSSKTSYAKETLLVEYDESKTTVNRIISAVTELGYKVAVVEN